MASRISSLARTCARAASSSASPRTMPSSSRLTYLSRSSSRFTQIVPGRGYASASATGSPAESPTSTPTATALEPTADMTPAEVAVFQKLVGALPGTTKLRVQDISGGCGSMYGIEIESADFKGLGMVKQQRMVNEILKEELKSWHGVQLRTKAA